MGVNLCLKTYDLELCMYIFHSSIREEITAGASLQKLPKSEILSYLSLGLYFGFLILYY